MCIRDRYVAISRKIAGIIGIDLFDNSTFETNRLMFWPSTPKDMDYYFKVQDGPWIDADEVLNSYADWKDSSLWPTASSRFEAVDRAVKKQEDPTIKRGLIGAFCRTYSIPEAIETFLSDTYVPSALEDRYTYTKGSASAGLIVYEDKFAYSHHGTDPVSYTHLDVYKRQSPSRSRRRSTPTVLREPSLNSRCRRTENPPMCSAPNLSSCLVGGTTKPKFGNGRKGPGSIRLSRS